jgi:hydroxypyruvate reductase
LTEDEPGISSGEARLRRDAHAIFRAALVAVDPERLVRDALLQAPVRSSGRLVVLAVGKAALGMARGAADLLGEAISRGIVITPTGSGGDAPAGFEIYRGGHPLPDSHSLAGARRVRGAVQESGADDHVLLLLSGGGSAMLTLPHADVSLEDVRAVAERLMRAGAGIRELNTVRKHLETLKGGRLAALAHPARVSALILSDVVGDPPDVIGSGPVSPDPTTYADALQVLEGRGILGEVPGSVRAHLERGARGELEETPKPGDPTLEQVGVRIVGSAALAARRATDEAARLGYQARLESAEVTGEARVVGESLGGRAVELRAAGRTACSVFAGETTVTVCGMGRGGRNQELALAAAMRLRGQNGVLVLSAGTDGLDGPTDAAGAIATGTTAARAERLGLDPAAHLERNDSYTFFDALGDLVRTGPTGTNVMDLMLVLAADPSPAERR